MLTAAVENCVQVRYGTITWRTVTVTSVMQTTWKHGALKVVIPTRRLLSGNGYCKILPSVVP